ncbi:MAG: hypothetical protein PHR35_05400, partial [Kiritimatiellae bacterium]|nr:hypothetical protein [Kiritimatiellia bacterium]
IVCALELKPAWPEAGYLLARMCDYAAGAAFRPAMGLSPQALEALKMGTQPYERDREAVRAGGPEER